VCKKVTCEKAPVRDVTCGVKPNEVSPNLCKNVEMCENVNIGDNDRVSLELPCEDFFKRSGPNRTCCPNTCWEDLKCSTNEECNRVRNVEVEVWLWGPAPGRVQ
jgi:hypothetical protein